MPEQCEDSLAVSNRERRVAAISHEGNGDGQAIEKLCHTFSREFAVHSPALGDTAAGTWGMWRRWIKRFHTLDFQTHRLVPPKSAAHTTPFT